MEAPAVAPSPPARSNPGPRPPKRALDADEVAREVRRLAPWYYAFDFGCIHTDSTPPFDHWGHRVVSVPRPREGFWAGTTVLDLGCNEGGYAFSALEAGASRVHGIDCRAINVEKARLAARAFGHDGASFEVAEVDPWLGRQATREFDHVLCCGLLYHLPSPWKTLARAARLARRGLVLTSVLAGGPPGYTPFEEAESIGASADPARWSQMPNDALTLVAELRGLGFFPLAIHEVPTEHQFWAGCSVVAERDDSPRLLRLESASRADAPTAFVRLLGASPATLELVLYDRQRRPLELLWRVETGRPEGQAGFMRLPATRSTSDSELPAHSRRFELALPQIPEPGQAVAVEVRDASGVTVVQRRYRVG